MVVVAAAAAFCAGMFTWATIETIRTKKPSDYVTFSTTDKNTLTIRIQHIVAVKLHDRKVTVYTVAQPMHEITYETADDATRVYNIIKHCMDMCA